VGVNVDVGVVVTVAVRVGVDVGVAVAVGVSVGVDVGVDVAVGVNVGAGVGVGATAKGLLQAATMRVSAAMPISHRQRREDIGRL